MPGPATSPAAVWRKRATAYGFAIVVTGLTLTLRLSLSPWLGDQPVLILFMLPILFSAYVGGLGPGLTATLISAWGVQHFVIAKEHNMLFFEGSVDLWRWSMLLANGLLISLLTEALHRSRKRIEESRNLQAVTLASIGDAVICTDRLGRVTFMNAEAERLTEWTNAEAKNQALPAVFRIVNETTGQTVPDPVAQVLATGSIVGLANHTLLLGRHGRETPIDDSAAPIQEARGSVAGVVLVFRDCTEKRKAADALVESRALYRSLVEKLPAGIYRKDAAGHYVFVNERFCELRGIRPEQFLGKLSVELPDSETTPKADGMKHHDLIMRTGQTVEVFEEHRRSDGKTLYFQVVKTPVRDANGKIVGTQGIMLDATERKMSEKAVSDRERLLRQVIDLVPHYIFAKSRDSRHLFANRACAQGNGRTPEQMVGRSDLDLGVNPEQAEKIMGDDREVIDSGKAKFIPEERVTRPDGTTGIFETIKVPFTMVDTNEQAVLGVAVDITEKRLAEEKFAREQARFKLIFDTVPIGIALHTTRPDGSVERLINDAHLRIAGLTRSQHDEPGIYERISHPDDYALQKHFQEQVRAGKIQSYSLEKRYLHADGKVVWVTFSYQREVYADGTTTALTTVVDITPLKAVELQLRQLAVIVESTEDAIIGNDLTGAITSWNKGAETLFGYSAAEAVGKILLSLYPPELQGEKQELMTRIARGESVEHFQTDRLRKDGRRIRVSATLSPLRDAGGKVIGSATIARDITRQQMLEDQLRQSQKMEAIGQLAGGVAHDFNNILAVIQMQIELARMDGEFTREHTLCLDEIQTAASRGANLTRQLLLFSRRQRLQPRELDLTESITGMAKMLRRILGEQIQMQFKHAGEPLMIRADAGMMDQVLMNLTLNARDAMPEGGLVTIETTAVEIDELTASQSAQARPGSFVRLSVTDTGCGIRPDILPRIFEPFFTTKDVGKGTGLGLATVFSIVQQHQGWISVASQPGHGAVFEIYLPRLAADAAAAAASPSPLDETLGGTETILVVEDDDSLRASVLRCLLQLGYRLYEANSGAAAMGIWAEHHAEIDLLVTDLVMPGGMSGNELGERFRRDNPNLGIIHVSGYSAETFREDFAAAAGVKFLPKPFAAQALGRTVRSCLDELKGKKSAGQ